MTKRRTVIMGLGAVGAVPSAAMGQASADDALPNCSQSQDMANGWTWRGSVINRTAVLENGAAPDVSWSFESAAGAHEIDGFADLGYPNASFGKVNFRGDQLESLRMAVTMPRPKTEKGDMLDKDFLVGRSATLEIYLDGSTEVTAFLRSVTDFADIRIDPIPDWLFQKVLTAQSMDLRLQIESVGWTAFRASVGGLREAHEEGRKAALDHAATVQLAQGCEQSTCMMTTAAVDMLGRRDDCFELTQMRRLREVFSAERSVIEAYLRASKDLLRYPLTSWTKVWLGLFYALVVWPTALLVAMGAMHAARRVYLSGFQLFFGRFT